MYPKSLKSVENLADYERNCEIYDEIIKMFAELGSGKLERRDVLNNIKTMVENGLIEQLENVVDEIEFYEDEN